ncbi:MAG: N-acetylmuramoyl-L-alanine amidase [Elusimicrobia bacterium]|nr:N-acetylmuramoyl-L-alanine amidase [Elusimicrobiota bacterium]
MDAPRRLAAAMLLLASSSYAQTPPASGKFEDMLRRVGLPADAATTAPPAVNGVILQDADLPPEDQKTNFSYGEISQRLEKTILGRRKRRSRTGVTPADRVDKGEIRYIVIHSSLGTYKGTISQLQTHPQASHFIIALNGDVTRMVDIKNIALHVKNKEINAASIGIETENFTRNPKRRGQPIDWKSADWDPDLAWRLYASLAWLIRAVAKECGVARDEAHIIGHLDADAGIPDGHTDPGPYFYDHAYPAFEARFPGAGVTPRKYLMMLVNDDTPPKLYLAKTAAGTIVAAREENRTGIAKLALYRLGGGAPSPVSSWEAAEHELPPASASLPVPSEPGAYRVEAFDLVGNFTRSKFSVSAPDAAPTKLNEE